MLAIMRYRRANPTALGRTRTGMSRPALGPFAHKLGSSQHLGLGDSAVLTHVAVRECIGHAASQSTASVRESKTRPGPCHDGRPLASYERCFRFPLPPRRVACPAAFIQRPTSPLTLVPQVGVVVVGVLPSRARLPVADGVCTRGRLLAQA